MAGFRRFNRGVSQQRRYPRRRLHVEELEDRCLLDATTLVNSFLTASQGQYAQVISGSNVAAGPQTTWTGVSTATLGDVQRISYSSNYVYVQAPDFASYVMGPWYLDSGDTQVFPNYPTNQNLIMRFPVTSQPATTHTATGLGEIGLMVNGVVLFNMLDGFSWNNTTQQDSPGMGGQGYWNRDANFAEEVTFDHARAHQPQNGEYHYHSNPTALRAQLDDNLAYTGTTDVFPHSDDDDVDAHSATFSHDFPYEENTTNLHHSPILGWAFDGNPIYGPYGYSTATNAASAITRLDTGFRLRTMSQRTSLPGWAAQKRFGESVTLNGNGEYTLSSTYYGPAVSTQNPLGKYIEDYEFVSGLGDLDKYNSRFAVTPEFPQGTYAYFVTIDSTGEAVFPYVVGPQYYGTVAGGKVSSITESVTVAFDVSVVATAGITLTQSGGSTSVTEAGATDSFTLVLASQPSADVTITISPGSGLSVSPSSLTFTSSNWNTARTVTVSAVDDTLAQGTRTSTIGFAVTSSDSAYNNYALTSINVTINDNEATTVSGTSGADKIVVAPSSDQLSVLVTVNGTTTTLPASLQQLAINAGAGADTITITTPNVPITVEGGTGTDSLIIYGTTSAANTFMANGTLLDVNGKSQTMLDLESVVVNGGTSADTFTVQQVPAQPLDFKGGSGTDRIVGPDTTNAWAITASNTGTLNSSVKFSAVESLGGGTAADTFTFNASTIVTGAVDGGAGTDVLDFSAWTAAVTVNLQAGTASGTGGCTNVESIKGGKSSDKLIGVNQTNVWNISSTNSGDVNGVAFQSVENLTGGSGADQFLFAAGVAVTGAIDGGAGSDQLDYTNYTSAVSVNLATKKATGAGSFNNMEAVNGGAGTDTLTGATKTNTWTLTGTSAGSVNDGTTTFTFAALENLTGGSGTDTFLGGWSGILDGGSGIDTRVGGDSDQAWAITATNTGTLDGRAYKNVENLRGGAGVDTFTFSAAKTVSGKVDGGAGSDILDWSAYTTAVFVNLQTLKATSMASFASVETFRAGSATTNTISAANAANAWALTGSNAGTITSASSASSYTGFANLTGGTGADAFTLDAAGAWTGLLNGNSGTDTLTASSSITNVWTATTLNGQKYTGIEVKS